MTTIVFQKDKRSGITYAYESVSYWDKEKKQSRAKRTLIGRVNQEADEIEPTDGRGRRRKTEQTRTAAKPGPVPANRMERLFYGAIYLFLCLFPCSIKGTSSEIDLIVRPFSVSVKSGEGHRSFWTNWMSLSALSNLERGIT